MVTKIHEISATENTDASEEERNMLPFYTRKVLIEEALTLRAIAQTSHVVQVIVRHGDKYYNTNGKHNLIPLLITIMTRLGTSSTAEHRQLAVKVASLLVDWQKQSFDEGSVFAGNHKLI